MQCYLTGICAVYFGSVTYFQSKFRKPLRCALEQSTARTFEVNTVLWECALVAVTLQMSFVKPATHDPSLSADNDGSCVAGFSICDFAIEIMKQTVQQ